MVKCPKCESSSFKVETIAPAQSNFKISIVACSSCSTAIGTLEAEAVGILVYKLANVVNNIAARLGC